MRQFPVALFILFPAELDPSFIGIDVFLPLRKMRRQRFLVLDAGNHRGFDQLHIAFAARLKPVNLAPESGLASIQPATVQKDRAADLSILLLPFCSGFSRMLTVMRLRTPQSKPSTRCS